MASQLPPRVSIVILTYNQLDYTRKCVASVVRHTRQPYELIFVDNASSDGTLEYLRTIPNARLIANSDNLGFAGGNNQGLAIAEGDYVVLLNNDAIVTPDWLTRLLAPFERDSRVGFAGPRSNYVAGDQLLADVAYQDLEDLDGFALQRAVAHAGHGKLTAFIVGFCLALRRTVVERIGGLDTRFGNGNYEDNDYCLRAVRAGWLGWIADDVFVHHYGHRTFIGAGIDWSASMQQNGQLFAAKWGLESSSQGPDFSGLGPVLSAAPNPQRDCFALPQHVTFTRITPGLAAYHRGIQALQQGALEQAIHELQAAVAERADVADFQNALAAAYYEAGRYDLALGALRRALELAPHDAAIRANYDEVRQYGALLAAVPRDAQRILVAAGDADCGGLSQALAAPTGEREIFVDA